MEVVPQAPKELKPSACLPTDLKEVVQLKAQAKQLIRGKDINAEVSKRVILMTLTLQENKLRKKGCSARKASRGCAMGVRADVCRLLSISSPTYHKINNNYLLDRSIYSSGLIGEGRDGNPTSKASWISRIMTMRTMIREFVRTKRQCRERVTARQILTF